MSISRFTLLIRHGLYPYWAMSSSLSPRITILTLGMYQLTGIDALAVSGWVLLTLVTLVAAFLQPKG